MALELDCLEGGGIWRSERCGEAGGAGRRWEEEERGGIENQENSKRNQGKGEGEGYEFDGVGGPKLSRATSIPPSSSE